MLNHAYYSQSQFLSVLVAVSSVCSDSPGAPQHLCRSAWREGALWIGVCGLQLSLSFATAIGKHQLFLCHLRFSAISVSLLSALMTGHCPSAAWCSQHSPALPRNSPHLLSSPSSDRELWVLQEAASLFLSVHCPTPRVLTCGSSYAQIPCLDVLVCSLCIFC